MVRANTGVSHAHSHWTMFIDHLFQARLFAVPSTDRASLMARQLKNLPAVQETQETCVQSLGWEDPLGQRMATTPVFLPENSRGQRTWRATAQRVTESDPAERLSRAQLTAAPAADRETKLSPSAQNSWSRLHTDSGRLQGVL